MADVKVTNTRRIEGISLTVQDLRELIAGVDGSCRVSINQSHGDRPGESGSTSVTILDVKEQRITRGDGGVVPR